MWASSSGQWCNRNKREMKIVVDDNIPFIRGRLEKIAEVVYADQSAITRELVKDADAIIIRTRTEANEALLGGSSVKLVATATIGTDHVDLDWCKSQGIAVENCPGCNAPGVAQYVWSALLRKGFDPKRHRLGIVGCGNVGSIVRNWGERLGAEVIVNDPPRKEMGIIDDYAGLDELLATCDCITLHTPLTHNGQHPTFHMIGERELGLMKPKGLLVNAARGPVVDGDALKKALKERRVRAVVDTWEWEPALDAELLDLTEYGTFHIAGYSHEGKERATRMVLEAVGRHFGVEVNTDGLAEAYVEPAGLCPQMILDSYDPGDDDDELRLHPEDFDRLRHDYNYRHEVGFSKE